MKNKKIDLPVVSIYLLSVLFSVSIWWLAILGVIRAVKHIGFGW